MTASHNTFKQRLTFFGGGSRYACVRRLRNGITLQKKIIADHKRRVRSEVEKITGLSVGSVKPTPPAGFFNERTALLFLVQGA